MTDKIEITRDMANYMIGEAKMRIRCYEQAAGRPMGYKDLSLFIDGFCWCMKSIAQNYYEEVMDWILDAFPDCRHSEVRPAEGAAKMNRLKRKYLLRDDVYQAIMDLMPYGGCDSEFNNGRYFATGVIMGRLGNVPVREIEDE